MHSFEYLEHIFCRTPIAEDGSYLFKRQIIHPKKMVLPQFLFLLLPCPGIMADQINFCENLTVAYWSGRKSLIVVANCIFIDPENGLGWFVAGGGECSACTLGSLVSPASFSRWLPRLVQLHGCRAPRVPAAILALQL